MKKSFLIACLVCAGVFLNNVRAQEMKSVETAKIHAVELRVGADFTKHFDRPHITLNISEEIRSRLFETGTSAYFSRSYTTVQFGWHPIDYLKLETGYTLRLYGNKGWSDPNEFLRHRVFFALIGQVRLGQWKLSLRERLDVNMRTDSVNTDEKNKTDLRLRHRFQVDYTFFNKPVKLFASCELKNTLIAPTDYLNAAAGSDMYSQYLSDVRARFGVRWRITKRSSMDFIYRFDYAYNRDINITKVGKKVELTNAYEYAHILSICYNFDW